MDPVSQGALGAVFAQAGSGKHHGSKHNLFRVALIGALAGMAADLDVLIRSSEDPLLFLEYHRHFTHSLFFIPIGGFVCGLLSFLLFGKRWQLSLRHFVAWATLGYATHGLLDGCTSYGTYLLWPFSDTRFAWDIISIVDPLFTIPLMFFVLRAAFRQSRRYAVFGIAWIACYLALGYLQHERAMAMGVELAASREHQPQRLEVKPSFANLLVWKVIYEHDGRFYVDAVKPGLSGRVVWSGESIARLNVERDFPWLEPDSQQARDIQRFNHFSAGFTAVDSRDENRIIDIRYSMLPHEIEALWGIELSRSADPDEHVDYYTTRSSGREAAAVLWQMLRE